jgi:hypothetical protein
MLALLIVMNDFSLRRQRRLYQQPSGGWVLSERAPSHLLPTTRPACNINNEHSTTTAPTNHTTQQKQLRQRAAINNAIVLSQSPGLLLPKRPDSRRCSVLRSINQVNERCNQQYKQAKECVGEIEGCGNEKGK